jgi:iron complex transport system substrate-binding protein
MRRVHRFLVCTLALLLLPVLAAAQETRTFTDSAGRQVQVPARVERVYAAGPPASVLVFSLSPDKLIGWTSAFRPAERPFIPERYADLPALGRLTGRGNTANVEVVMAAKPDVIVDYGSITPTYVSLADRVQEQTGIPYILIDGSFGAMQAAYELLGELLGEAGRARELSSYIDGTLAEVDAASSSRPPQQRPRVYYARGPNGLQTGLAGSINVESLDRVGAINVAGEALGKGGLAQVSMEQVLAWDPEVIITIDPGFYAGIWSDPLWGGVAAVRTKRVYLSPNVPFGWVDFPPSVNRAIGLHWLSWVLYPDQPHREPRATVRDFFTRFYHRTPTDEQITALLTGSGALAR